MKLERWVCPKPCLKGQKSLLTLLLVMGVLMVAGGVSAENLPPRVALPEWQYHPGPLNAITDVPGVKVGHVTLNQQNPVPIHTGVTVVLPHSGNLAQTGLWASGGMINGNGALTGLDYIQTTGILNSPIVLTNTFAVGEAYQGVFAYFIKHYPGPTANSTVWQGQLPVVGECYDGYFNTIEAQNALKPVHTLQALELAEAGHVRQGRVGAGTGMRSFGLHAGIGSASRQLEVEGKRYTVGVLVNTNHSRFEDLRPAVKQILEHVLNTSLYNLYLKDEQDKVERSVFPRQGSIMVVIATDLPLLPHQLQALVTRAALGIGNTGSVINTTSGDGVIVFSTATPVAMGEAPPVISQTPYIHPDALSPVYRATVEAVTEAQLNALIYSHWSP